MSDVVLTDEEIIKNLDLVMNLEILEESDIWGELTDLVTTEEQDTSDILESEK